MITPDEVCEALAGEWVGGQILAWVEGKKVTIGGYTGKAFNYTELGEALAEELEQGADGATVVQAVPDEVKELKINLTDETKLADLLG